MNRKQWHDSNLSLTLERYGTLSRRKRMSSRFQTFLLLELNRVHGSPVQIQISQERRNIQRQIVRWTGEAKPTVPRLSPQPGGASLLQGEGNEPNTICSPLTFDTVEQPELETMQ